MYHGTGNIYPVGRKSMSGFGIKIFAADDRWNSSTGYPPLFDFQDPISYLTFYGVMFMLMVE